MTTLLPVALPSAALQKVRKPIEVLLDEAVDAVLVAEGIITSPAPPALNDAVEVMFAELAAAGELDAPPLPIYFKPDAYDRLVAVEETSLVPLHLRSGADYHTEDRADHLLAAARRQCGADDGCLSKDQQHLRWSKEVYNHQGVADESLVMGIYRRAHNPFFGQRPKGNKNSDD